MYVLLLHDCIFYFYKKFEKLDWAFLTNIISLKKKDVKEKKVKGTIPEPLSKNGYVCMLMINEKEEDKERERKKATILAISVDNLKL